MKTILSIVPRLPPAVDGVGDYAFLLAEALAAQHHLSTQFIACDPLQLVAVSLEPSPIQLLQRSSALLSATLDRLPDADTLLLHYVGYGYAKRGCPLWLVDAISKWRQAKASRTLIVMFHEVYASSYQPWNSQFWTSPIQQKIARDLNDCADLVLTSTQIYADKIAKLSPQHHGKIQVLPIFSTIGECDGLKPLAARRPYLVTFGNTRFRKAIYTDSLAQLTTICQQLEIAEIYDIGNNSAEIVKPVPQVEVHAMGVIPAAEITSIFRMARVGFLNYPTAYLAKSTIFAAFASHKLLPVFDRQNIESNRDGIVSDRHYWSLQNSEDRIDLDTAQAIADRAHQWYADHNIAQTASRLATLLNQI